MTRNLALDQLEEENGTGLARTHSDDNVVKQAL